MKDFVYRLTTVDKIVSLLTFTFILSTVHAQNPTPVLDGYAYQLSGNLTIDVNNQIISMESNMTQCQQANGDPPLDTKPLALHTNSQFLGLKDLNYNTNHDNLYFNSETMNLVCNNGVYVDTLFSNSFE